MVWAAQNRDGRKWHVCVQEVINNFFSYAWYPFPTTHTRKPSNKVSLPVKSAPCPFSSMQLTSFWKLNLVLSHTNQWSLNRVLPPSICIDWRGEFRPSNSCVQGSVCFRAEILARGFSSKTCSPRCNFCSWASRLLFNRMVLFQGGPRATFPLPRIYTWSPKAWTSGKLDLF